jgi:hypothetical protein
VRPDANPLIPQFWLWGVDTGTGDLNASGFVRHERPSGAGTRSSLYVRDGVWLHANGLWLAALGVLYHRGQERFYWAKTAHFVPEPPTWLEPFSFQDGLEILRPIMADYENSITAQRGLEYRARLLELPAPFGVRLAWAAWRGWLEPDPIPNRFDHTHDVSLLSNQQVLQPA